MAITIARVPTTHASRYLQQLCKHWSHKFAVDFTAERGTIPLPLGLVTLTAEPDTLDVRIEAEDAAGLRQAKEVVASHLDRFAFRQAPLPFGWVDA